MLNLFKINIDTNRVFGLDILRAFAILFVVYLHTGNFVPKALLPYYKSLYYDGVGIFFVLSGFLIGGILIKQIETYKFNTKSLKYFWLKRWSRTLPNYFLFLFVAILLEYISNPGFSIVEKWSYFIFSQNLVEAPPDFFSHSWSLSVEEWFYLLIPVIIFFLLKTKLWNFKQVFLGTIISIIILVTSLRIWEIQTITNWEEYKNLIYGVVFRLDSLMYGMLGAYIAYFFPKKWKDLSKISLLIFIGLFVLQLILKEFIDNNNYFLRNLMISLTSLTVLSALPFFSNLNTSKSIFVKPITLISLISYSLYLVNSIVVEKLEVWIDWDRIMSYLVENFSIQLNWTIALMVNYGLSWIISIGVSILVYKYFEVPTTNFIRNKIKIKLDNKTS